MTFLQKYKKVAILLLKHRFFFKSEALSPFFYFLRPKKLEFSRFLHRGPNKTSEVVFELLRLFFNTHPR